MGLGGQRPYPRACGPVLDSLTVWLFYSGSLGQRKKRVGFADEADICLIYKLFGCRFRAYEDRPVLGSRREFSPFIN